MQYKMVACILILSVFSFVLAAPVPVQEVREACANAMEGDDNVIIVSEKRASPSRLGQAGEESDLYPLDSSDTEWTPPSSSPQSPSASASGSGGHPGVDTPSSPPAGSTSPQSPKVLSTPGATEVPLDQGAFKPGATTEIHPASSSGPRVSWSPPPSPPAGSTSPLSSKVLSTPGAAEVPLDQGAFRPGTATEIRPASPSGPKAVSWTPVTKVHFVDEPILPFPPPAAPPRQKGFVGKMKSFFGKVGKFRPRFQRAVDIGALTARGLGESSDAPATSATDGILGGAGMS